MDRKPTEEGTTEGEEDDNKSLPYPSPQSHRRDGSPAMSIASAALEWDPSADVGAMGNDSSPEQKSQNVGGGGGVGGGDEGNQSNQLNVLEGYSKCNVVFEPNYELEGGRPGSRRAQHQKKNGKGCSSSTPSASPAPLRELQYSPVVPQSAYNHDQISSVQGEAGSSRTNNGSGGVNKQQDTSDDDNDNVTEGRRTPGSFVSEAGTDWEYDHEKNEATKSLSNWQTSGLTKSEIEYQKRKKNGSSTSIASSVLMLQVEAKIGSPGRGSPSRKKSNKKTPVQSSSLEKSDPSSELDRRIQRMLDAHQILNEKQAKRKHQSHGKRSKHRTEVTTTTSSDPSTMCGLVKDYVKVLEDDSSQENIQYDVLKKHRDYHLMKVWKQISTLEKLNMQLLRLENARKREPKSSSRHGKGRSEEDYTDFRPRQERHTEEISSEKENFNIQMLLESGRLRKSKSSKHDGKIRAGDRDRDSDIRNANNIRSKHKHRNEKDEVSTEKEDFNTTSSRTSKRSNDNASSRGGEGDADYRSKQKRDQQKKPSVVKEPKKPSVGFFVPLFYDENKECDKGYDIKGSKKIQDCFRENFPGCYQSIKDRDEFILQRKIDRQIREESLLKEILDSNIPYEEVEDYMSTYLKYCNEEQRKRAIHYMNAYKKEKKYDDGRRIISSKEMRERTAKLLHYDFLEKQRKEAHERKKEAIRIQQKNFSKNLRRYQQLGKVNVPDQLKIGRI